MTKNAEMSFRFVVALNDRLYEADESVGYLSLMDVEKRLARALLLFHKKMNAGSNAFSLPISKKDLASFIGTSPETVSRKLLSFASQKIIELHGQRLIKILELVRLKQVAGGEDS
ncbi:Crp/Fnr family transcriptional regulator [Neobacillus sp. SM06]|uniref:Crp/Fnr family transcriptional regulator n=1 Tax=Neobacillus sp. SM06 TaxID=3422492 RepID=UPI003D2716AB